MISISSTGSFGKTEAFLNRIKRAEIFNQLNKYGQKGVDALSKATPVDSRLTATSWSYEIVRERGRYTIIWKNSNVINGVPIAIILQYGHATGTGGWVEGKDYINPVIHPLFDEIANSVWKEVTRNG